MKNLQTITITTAMAVWMGASGDTVRAQEKEISVPLSEKVSLKLVLIPAGSFLMGSPEEEKGRAKNEGPQHEVTISQPFYMGVTEVTQEQYEAVMGLLGRCRRVLRESLKEDRQEYPLADRGAMGIRLPCREQGPLLLR